MDGMSSNSPIQSQDTRKSPQPSTSFTNPYTKNVESAKQDDKTYSFLPENRSAGKKRRRIRKAVSQETIYEVMSSSLLSEGQDFEATTGRSALVIKIAKKKVESASHHGQLVAPVLHKKSQPNEKADEHVSSSGKATSPRSEKAVAEQMTNETMSPDSLMWSQPLEKSSDQLAHLIHTSASANITDLTFHFMQQSENQPIEKADEHVSSSGKAKSPRSEKAVAEQMTNETMSPDSLMWSQPLEKSSDQLAHLIHTSASANITDLTFHFMQQNENQPSEKADQHVSSSGKAKSPRSEKAVAEQMTNETMSPDSLMWSQPLEKSSDQLAHLIHTSASANITDLTFHFMQQSENQPIEKADEHVSSSGKAKSPRSEKAVAEQMTNETMSPDSLMWSQPLEKSSDQLAHLIHTSASANITDLTFHFMQQNENQPSEKADEHVSSGKAKSPSSEKAVAVQMTNESMSPDSLMWSQPLEKSSDQFAHLIHKSASANITDLTFHFMQQSENQPIEKADEHVSSSGKAKSPRSEKAVAEQMTNETMSPDSLMWSQPLEKSSDQLAHLIHTSASANITDLTFHFMQQNENQPSEKADQHVSSGKAKSPPSEKAVAVQMTNETMSPDSLMWSQPLEKSSDQLAHLIHTSASANITDLTFHFMQQNENQPSEKADEHVSSGKAKSPPSEKAVAVQMTNETMSPDSPVRSQPLEKSSDQLAPINSCTEKMEFRFMQRSESQAGKKKPRRDDVSKPTSKYARTCGKTKSPRTEKTVVPQTMDEVVSSDPQTQTQKLEKSVNKSVSSIKISTKKMESLKHNDQRASFLPKNRAASRSASGAKSQQGHEDLKNKNYNERQVERQLVAVQQTAEVMSQEMERNPQPSTSFTNSSKMKMASTKYNDKMASSLSDSKFVHNKLKIQNSSINDEQLHGEFYEKNDRTASPPLDHVDISNHFNYYISMLEQKVDMLNVYSNRICPHNNDSKNDNDKISPDNFSKNNCRSRNCPNKQAISDLKKDFWKYLDQIKKFMKKEKLSHNQQKALKNKLSTIVRRMNKESDAPRKRKRNTSPNTACKKVKISENTYQLSPPAHEPNITIESILKALIESVRTEDYITLAKIIVWANNSSERKLIGKKLFYSVKYNEESILHILENIIQYIEKSTQKRDDIKLITQVCVDFILYFATLTKWNEAFKLIALLKEKRINPITFKPIVHNTSCIYVASLCSQTMFFNGYYSSATNIMLSNNLILADKTKWLIDGEDDDFCITYNTVMFLMDNFFHLRLPDLIIRLFDKILKAQSTLYSPIDVSKYFGPLLLLMFENLNKYKHKALELFLTVYKLDESFILPGTTYRVLVIIAMNAKMYQVVSDLVDCATEAYVYSIKEAESNTISLSTCFLHEEMEAYIYVWCSWFLSGKNNSTKKKHKALCVQLKQMHNCDYKDTQDQIIPDILKSANPLLSAAILRIKSILHNLTNMEITPNIKVRRNKIFLSCKLSACLLSSVKRILNIH